MTLRMAGVLPALLALVLPALGAPVALTDGPGDDVEAAWSPDGTKIAFQSDRGGDFDLYVLDVATAEVSCLVPGPGDACYPAWSPDGQSIAYIYSNITTTAVQGIENGYNVFVVPSTGGEPKRLTSGLAREYTPTFSPDGKSIYFSSTAGMKAASICLQRVPVEGGDAEVVLAEDQADVGLMQPDVSPDGKYLAFGRVSGFRSNWTIWMAKTATPKQRFQLTAPETAMYAPRWSPDGTTIACTGYRVGDPGWGIYLLDIETGARARVETGPGNSRTPSWSPDGNQLLFENNQTGSYKLYRMPVPEVAFEPSPALADEELKPLLRFDFTERPAGDVKDLSGNGNDGKIVGDVKWEDGALVFGTGGYVTVPEPKGMDFGRGSFSVEATVEIAEHTGKLRLILVCDYPEHHLGWQFFINEPNSLYFNSRGIGGSFIGAKSDEPLPVGRKVRIVGTRYRDGLVSLYIDGERQGGGGSGARFSYGKPTQLRIGTQFNGGSAFPGKVYNLTVYSGLLSDDGQARSLKEFLGQ